MGTRTIPPAVAGLVVWFTVVTAEAAQNDSLCFVTVAASLETREAGNQAKLIRNRIQELGLGIDDIRLRLSELGYRPSTLDSFLLGTCDPPYQSDSVGLALQALGLVGASELDAQSGLEDSRGEVTIVGEVGRPSNVPFREGMTLGDLINEAGRLKQTADLTIEIYRVMRSVDGERQPIPEIHSIRVDSAYLVNHDAKRLYAKQIAGFTYLVDRAAAFKLMPYDRVVVRTPPRARLRPPPPPHPPPQGGV